MNSTPQPDKEPERLLCPITQVMLKDPVFTEAGNTYERDALLELWRRRDDFFDPLFNRVLTSGTLRPNWDKRREIQDFLAEFRTYVPQGWESREVPSPPAEEKGSEDRSLWHVVALLLCPRRQWMRVTVMAIGSFAGGIGSLIVEFTCLSENMQGTWPCSQLEAVLKRFSPWLVAPLSVIVGGLLFGAFFGALAAVALVLYICLLWLLQLIPQLLASVVARWRGRQAMAEAHAEAQRRVQARLAQQAEAEAAARARAQERALAAEQSLQEQQLFE